MDPAATDCNRSAELFSKMKTDQSPALQEKAPGGYQYKDHSQLTEDDKELTELLSKADAEGVKGTDQTFPVKLHQLLSGSEEDGFSHVMSWQPHGRSFIVKKHKEFVAKVLPCCFRQTKFASFQRQLNLYGFRRITQGRDKGGYYHELFLRGRTLLALKMQRTKVKGTGARKPSSPETEPDFYAMPYVYEKDQQSASAPSPCLRVGPPDPLSSGRDVIQLQREESKCSSPVNGSPRMEGTRSLSMWHGANNSAAFPSILGVASVPGGWQRATMAQMITAASRLQEMRGRQLAVFGGRADFSGPDDPLLYSALAQHQGPLHLNANNMPCDCSVPSF